MFVLSFLGDLRGLLYPEKVYSPYLILPDGNFIGFGMMAQNTKCHHDKSILFYTPLLSAILFTVAFRSVTALSTSSSIGASSLHEDSRTFAP